MSTPYEIHESRDTLNELSLEESSGELRLRMDVSTGFPNVSCYESHPLTEDEIVAMAVALLGPAFYFTDSEVDLVNKFKAEIKRRGFTSKFETP